MICNVFTFPDIQIFSFCLTRKTYPKLCKIPTMRCVIKSPMAEKIMVKE